MLLCSIFTLVVGIGSVIAQEEERRFQKDIDAFEADRVENNIPEGAVLCVGSSSMRMWGNRIERDLAPLTVVARGFGGSKFSDVLHFFDELVAVYKPRAILVYEGDNDVGSGMSPEAVFGDFMEFRKRVEELDPEIRIYVIGVKPSLVRWNLRGEIAVTNHLIETACKKDPKLTFIDVAEFLLDDSGKPRAGIFLDDGLHLNNVGYHLWAAAVSLKIVPAESKFEAQ
ncbi:hypothetical protein IEN85_03375 [Pelagicoccus sp. NFK12]|uniref:SGNH hydrolase-type esterase domain-containing protein n=1 Tax=Pelagicoccus enzymogenes TaxID=2773457 RepID=A0A927F621_9BACT|nr:GDSL-type esterase/lipase family protein [Pelagicoccus enzymogenes]MBD5778519.1 hypothetical protein [Pelagicoccus enzymogenes]MDQ8197119.1 GDSL-type esterase/lipase family protein [Pelagicoccus enzymogenes]